MVLVVPAFLGQFFWEENCFFAGLWCLLQGTLEIQEYSLASQKFNSVLLDLEDLITIRAMSVEKQADLRGHF